MQNNYGVMVSSGYPLRYYRSPYSLVWFTDLNIPLLTYKAEPQHWIGIL